MTAPASAMALREMVREILSEVIAEEVQGRVENGNRAGKISVAARERVIIGSQADLDAAVRRIIGAAQDSAGRAALERGELVFELALQGPTPSGQANIASVVHRVDKGAVTERHVKAAAEAGAIIVTARRVVVTPLARDRSRTLGVTIRKDTEEERC
jgi:hypothetical protein